MNFFKNVLNEMPTVVFVVDDNYRVHYANTAFIDFFNKDFRPLDEVGRAIGCADWIIGKCTHGHACADCEVRKALSDCMHKGKQVYKRLLAKEIKHEDGNQFYNIKMSVKSYFDEFRNTQLFICLVDDASKITEDSDDEISINKKLLNDLKKASKIQKELLPQRRKYNGIDIDYLFDQSFEVGGDFLNVFEIDEENVGAYIADVSGHGLSSGMITLFLDEIYPDDELLPQRALMTVKDKYAKYKFTTSEYITILPTVINVANKTITFSNAGHIMPLLLVGDDEIIEYSINGTPIANNWFSQVNYDQATIEYNKGDWLVFLTDGVVDLKNENGESFGIARFKELLSNTSHNIHTAKKEIQKQLNSFSAKLKVKTDDIAVMILQL